MAWKLPDWEQVTESAPCEVCGKPDWCQRSGDAMQCMRESRHHNRGEGLEKEDASGNRFYLWPSSNDTESLLYVPTMEPSKTAGPPAVRDRVYSEFTSQLTEAS